MRGRGSLGDPKGALEDKKWQKLTKIKNFQNFATIHFTQVNFFLFLHGSYAERVVQNGRWKWRPFAAQQGGTFSQKWLKLTKIFNLFYFDPSNSFWQHILVIFILILCKGVVENDRQGWGPLGAPPGGPKGPKMASELHPQGSVLALFGPLGQPLGHPGGHLRVPHYRLSFSTTSPHNTSVKQWKFVARVNWREQNRKIKDFGWF